MHFLLPLALLATSAFAISIDVPQDVLQCDTVLVFWDNSTAPVDVYYLAEGVNATDGIVVGNYSSGNSYNWTVAAPSGATLRLAIFDANNEFASSDVFTVGNSGDASCLNTTSA